MTMLGDSVRRRTGAPRSSRPRPKGRSSRKVWLIGVPLALLLPFAIGYLVAVRVLFPPPPVTSAGIEVPDLVGRTSADAGRTLSSAGLVLVDSVVLPHPSAPAGQIIAQSPLPGQQLRSGGVVLVARSAGRPRVMVPDVTGFGAERAIAMLQRSGFTVSQTTQESALTAGRVLQVQPAPGQVVELPASVTITVSVPLPIDTLPPDTGAVPRDTLSLHQGTNWQVARGR